MFLFNLIHQNVSTSHFVPLDLQNSIYCSVYCSCTDLAVCLNHNSNQKTKNQKCARRCHPIFNSNHVTQECHAGVYPRPKTAKSSLVKTGAWKKWTLIEKLSVTILSSFHCVIFITYTVTITELNRRNDIIHKLRMITIIASELCV